jgi:hypothetical protein
LSAGESHANADCNGDGYSYGYSNGDTVGYAYCDSGTTDSDTTAASHAVPSADAMRVVQE